VDARTDPDFTIMARTDALAVEGIEAAIDRAGSYIEAGADALFPEAIRDLNTYKKFTDAFKVPVLANITEFGLTPLFTVAELATVGVGIVLYPLSAFRAMNKAAELVYETVRKEGSQKSVIDSMQTRDELYQRINYYEYETALDKFLQDGDKK
ncbi:MAG: methylisocitrate lyase, partial [Actinobacteria bacterium]|nr:methylisocitrate lyase [Actinomycetota bacterium]